MVQQINCKQLDELNLTNISYIKIDIEGHEYEALLGMKKLLRREHPNILIEILNRTRTKIKTLNLLYNLGYHKHYKVGDCDYLFTNFI